MENNCGVECKEVKLKGVYKLKISCVFKCFNKILSYNV